MAHDASKIKSSNSESTKRSSPRLSPRFCELSCQTPASRQMLLAETLRKEDRASRAMRHMHESAFSPTRRAATMAKTSMTSPKASSIYGSHPILQGDTSCTAPESRLDRKSNARFFSLERPRTSASEWCPRNPPNGGPAPGAYWTGTYFNNGGQGRYGRTPQYNPSEYAESDNHSYVCLMSMDRKSSRAICTREKHNAPWPPPSVGMATLNRAKAENWPCPSISQTLASSVIQGALSAKTNPYKAWTELSS
jgi:hypothetical protein